MGTCFACGVRGHTGKYCYTQNPSAGVNTTCTTCGLWGHKPEYCPKTALADVSVENDVPPQGQNPSFGAPVELQANQVTSLGNSIDLCSVDQAPQRPPACSGFNLRIGSCSCGHIYLNSSGEFVDTSVAKPLVPQGIMSNRIELDLPPRLPDVPPPNSYVVHS